MNWEAIGYVLVFAGAVVAFVQRSWALGLIGLGLSIAGIIALF